MTQRDEEVRILHVFNSVSSSIKGTGSHAEIWEEINWTHHVVELLFLQQQKSNIGTNIKLSSK